MFGLYRLRCRQVSARSLVVVAMLVAVGAASAEEGPAESTASVEEPAEVAPVVDAAQNDDETPATSVAPPVEAAPVENAPVEGASVEPAPVEAGPVVDEAPPAEPPDFRFIYRTTNVFRWNPLGLITDNHIGVRRRLVKSDNLLLKDTFAGVGFTPVVTGAFARFGALAEVQPLSIMRLWASYDVVGYYGIFGLFQSFEGPSSNFSDSTISALGRLEPGDKDRNYANIGTQLTLGLDLQIKLGPIAARNFTRAVRGSFPMRPGDTVYYDQTYDVLAPNDGFFFSNDTDLFWVFDFGLVLGVRANTTYALYEMHVPELDNIAGTIVPQNPNGPTLRAGPMITYTFWNDPGSIFDRPTLLLITHMHLLHRWRTGADIPIWMPYVALGFQMQGDLKPWG